MRAGWFALGLAAFAAAAAAPLACGDPFSTADAQSSSAGGGGGGAPGSSSSVNPTAGGSGSASCKADTDCPGTDVGCTVRACINGACSTKTLKEQARSQVYGDCNVVKCNEGGKSYTTPEDTDVYDDGNPCTEDKCENNAPMSTAKEGLSCGTDAAPALCNLSGACVQCLEDDDCSSSGSDPHRCNKGKCVPASCTNAVKDGGETALNCGGPCSPCDSGQQCITNTDCLNGICKGIGGVKTCAPPACDDAFLNGSETDTDCGGSTCVPLGNQCANSQRCRLPIDCGSGVCKAGVCQAPSCIDGVKNQDETGPDCGGSCGSCP